ncbi:RING finger protein vilya [Eurosta solidaginis]|uniref:RING finger protein vilya n=1 Tax=Eurosta solidaginis TaxID=178769 RepID=UPI003530EA1D
MEPADFEIEAASSSAVNISKAAGLCWIHCNRCFEIYVLRRRRIVLLVCHHIICEKCVGTPPVNAPNRSNELICPLCKKMQCFRLLCNVMPAHFKELLNPEPWREPNERILNFQAKHRTHFKKGMYHQLFELDKIKKRCKLAEINSKKKYEKYERIRFERKRLEREVRIYKEQKTLQQRMRFETRQKNTHSDTIFNMNAFSEAKRMRTIDPIRAYTGSHNSQRTILNKSLSFGLV